MHLVSLRPQGQGCIGVRVRAEAMDHLAKPAVENNDVCRRDGVANFSCPARRKRPCIDILHFHCAVRPSHAESFARSTPGPGPDDDDDVYYPKGRKPREDEEGEESYEKQRQRPGGRGLDARSCASTGRKDVVREVKGIEKMSMLGAGRGARERGGRRLEVEVNAKRRSPSHYAGFTFSRRLPFHRSFIRE